MEALADPAVRKRLDDLGQLIPPKEKQTAEARRLPQGRDREMVADHQVGERQGRARAVAFPSYRDGKKRGGPRGYCKGVDEIVYATAMR